MPWVLTPAVAYTLAVDRELDRLEVDGLVLDRSRVDREELGRALLGPPRRWVDKEPNLTPEQAQALDRIVADRSRRPDPGQAQDRDQAQTAPELHPETAEDSGHGSSAGLDHEHPGRAARDHWQDRVRNEGLDPITEYLRNVPDPPDGDWS